MYSITSFFLAYILQLKMRQLRLAEWAVEMKSGGSGGESGGDGGGGGCVVWRWWWCVWGGGKEERAFFLRVLYAVC